MNNLNCNKHLWLSLETSEYHDDNSNCPDKHLKIEIQSIYIILHMKLYGEKILPGKVYVYWICPICTIQP